LKAGAEKIVARRLLFLFRHVGMLLMREASR